MTSAKVEHNTKSVLNTKDTIEKTTEKKKTAKAREYYEHNKEKVLERRKNYREENNETILEKIKQYREKHKEEIQQKRKEYYEKTGRKCMKNKRNTRMPKLNVLNVNVWWENIK